MLRKALILFVLAHFAESQHLNLARNGFLSQAAISPIPYNHQAGDKGYQPQNGQQFFQNQQQFSNNQGGLQNTYQQQQQSQIVNKNQQQLSSIQGGPQGTYQNQQQTQINNQGNNGNVGFQTYQDVGKDTYLYNSEPSTTRRTVNYNSYYTPTVVYTQTERPNYNNHVTSTNAPYDPYTDTVLNQNYGQNAGQGTNFQNPTYNENSRHTTNSYGDNSNLNNNYNNWNNNYNNNNNNNNNNNKQDNRQDNKQDEVGYSENQKQPLEHKPDQDRIIQPNEQQMIEIVFPPTLNYDEDDTEATTRASFLAYIQSKHKERTSTESNRNE